MNIIEKTAYQCKKCNRTYLDRKSAEQCCAPKHCEDCGKRIKPYRIVCESCRTKRLFNKAEKLTIDQWDGYIQRDGYGSNEGYFESISELLEWCEDEGTNPPDWVFCCELVKHRLNIDNAIETMLEEAYDDAWDDLVDEDGLRQFIDAWNAKQKVASYYPDYTKVVVLR